MSTSAMKWVVGMLLVWAMTCTYQTPEAFAANKLNGTIYGGSNPLANAAVTLANAAIQSQISSTKSNTSGAYTFTVNNGTYNMTVNPPAGSGFDQSVVNGIAINNADVTQNVVLIQKAVTVSGIVRGYGGIPVPSVEVRILNQSGGAEMGATTTNASGQFSLSVPVGTYQIMVRNYYNSSNKQLVPYSFYYYPVNNLAVSAATTVPDIAVPVVRVSGKTTDSNDVPVGGVTVSHASRSGLANSGYNYNDSVTSNAQGDYSILVLSGTGYNFTIDPPTGSGFAKNVVNGVDVTADLVKDMALSSAVTVSGLVRGYGGIPVPSVEVHILNQSGGAEMGATTTNASGQFSLSVPVGTYQIMVRNYYNSSNKQLVPYSFYYYPVSNLAVSAATAVPDIAVPVVRVSGKTTDSNGVPVGGVTVSHASRSGLANSGYNYNDSVTSNAQGDYSILVLSGTGYNFTIDPPTGSGFARTSVNNISVVSDISQGIILNLPDTKPPVIISGPLATSIDTTSAVIEWIANEPVTAVLYYGTTSPPASTVPVATAKSAHSETLSGLSPDTLYHVKAVVTDTVGNGPVSSTINSFRTSKDPLTRPPVILEGPTVETTNTSAIVTWSTDIPSTGSVYYGLTTPPTVTRTDTTLSTRHTITLSPLAANTKYYLIVDARNPRSTIVTTSSMIDFKTQADAPAPPVIVEGPLAKDISDSGASILWKTDRPASSGVSYNDGTAYGIASDDTMTIEHNVRLSSLTPSTQYSYTVASKDEMGSGPVISASSTFRTTAPKTPQPPVITERSIVVNTTDVTADIFWRTDKLADSVVQYGLTDALGFNVSTATVVTEHNITLLNLSPATTYYFKVSSTGADGTGPTTSEIVTFTTAATPSPALVFTKWPQIEHVSYDRVIVSWETNGKADSVVDYWKTTSDVMRVSDSTREKSHQITLSNLAASTTYTASVTSTNLNKNVANALISFTTSAPPGEPVHITGGPTVIGLTDSKASIKWRTDISADSRVQYGLQPSPMTDSEVESRYSKEHVVVLTNLQPGTTYYFSVTSFSPEQNSTTSSVYSFTTKGTPVSAGPVITGPTVTVQSDIQATVSWITNEPATSQVMYGTAPDKLDMPVGLPGLIESHQIVLTGLKPGVTYYLKAVSANPSGIATESLVISFSTYAVPVSWKVTPAPLTVGSISPSTAQQVNDGEVVSFAITPPTGQPIQSVSGCAGVLVDNVYTAGPIHSDCTLTVAFTTPLSVTLAPSIPSPQTVGASVAFTAAMSGDSGSYEYEFYYQAPNSSTWVKTQTYSSTATWNWATAGVVTGTYKIAVWSKRSGTSPADGYDTNAIISYTLNAISATASVILTPSVDSPQKIGSSVTFTAAGSGGSGSYEYEFYYLAPGSSAYVEAQAYSSSATWAWNTTGQAPGTYSIAVWARTAGTSPAAGYDKAAIISYTLSPVTVTDLILSSNVASPQNVGSNIAFNAVGSGGTGSYEYEFYYQAPNATSWVKSQSYSSTATWTWNTAGLPAGDYRIAAWAKIAGTAPVVGYDANAIISYTLNPITATGLTVTPNVASPQFIGTGIAFTAACSGGIGSCAYEFYCLAPGSVSWVKSQTYSSNATWLWETDGLPTGEYQIAVWTKTTGTTPASGYDANVILRYTLKPLVATAVNLTPSLASPQKPGTSVTFTATATGGTGSYEYEYFYQAPNSTTWTKAQSYSSIATWTWNTTGLESGIYTIAVRAKTAGSSPATGYDTNSITTYSISAVNATVTPSIAGPQQIGTGVVFAVTASGGTGSYEYEFYYQLPNSTTWLKTQTYGGNSSWSWDTTGLAAGIYNIRIWVKTASSSPAGGYDKAIDLSYTLSPLPATGITLTPGLASPQNAGTSITFVAVGSGGSGNYDYEFYYRVLGTSIWTKAQPYGSSNTWVWSTIGLPAGTYQVAAWTKTAGTSPAGGYDTSAMISYTLNPVAVTGLTVTPSLTSPQSVGANVTFTAAGSGGNGSYEYEFYYLAPGSTIWVKARPYSNTDTWSWNTSGLLTGTYQIAVWVKAAGSSPAGGYDKNSIMNFTLNPVTVTGLTVTSNVASPQSVGTAITLTAAASGGSGSYDYEFYYLAPGSVSWVKAQPYSSTATWTWNTNGLPVGIYQIAIWSKIAGSSPAGGYDKNAISSYTLNPVTVTGLTVTPSVASPQNVETSVTFTASGSGGSGSYDYEFYYLVPGSANWVKGRPYSNTATWAWNTSGLPAGTYQIAVWSKITGSSPAAGYDKNVLFNYTLSPVTVTGLTATTSVASPQNVGTAITLTASASGGSGSYDYEFYYLAPGSASWVKAQSYSNAATWAWNTGGLPAGTYQIAVWSKISGTTPVAGYDKNTLINYTLNPVTVTGLTVTPSVASPQNVGTAITLTAAASGGSGSYDYEFYYLAPGSSTWVKARPYGSTATWAWNTGGLPAGTYQIAVWSKISGTTPVAGYDKNVISSYDLN